MKDLLRLIACWVAFAAAPLGSGVVSGLLHLQFGAPPSNVRVSVLLPMVLRVAHGLEITADGFAYAALLVLLFGARKAAVPIPARVHATAH
ncbi:MAG TPA: hypothetical protein VKB47_15940 [Terracidiphilus sp.]|nr:hypothetical protein [Terracidiphilus sp.]